MSVQMWLILSVVLLFVEILTVGLTTIWFGIGACFAALASYLGADIIWQWVIFIVVSVFCLFLVRPIFKRLWARREKTRTNVDSVPGKTGVVKEKIRKHHPGRVSVNGIDWLAKSVEDEEIKEGTEVVIEKVEGATLLVSKRQ